MQLILNSILFCFILLLCGVSFVFGLCFGLRKKTKREPKSLTQEQERQIERQKRHEENFWNYDGSTQETI